MALNLTKLEKIELRIDQLVDELWFWQGMTCVDQRQRDWVAAKCDQIEQRIEDLRLLQESL